MATKGNTNNNLWWAKLFVVLGNVMNKVGISGFVVIAITVIIYTFSTVQQKAEIIDDWLLFKGPSTPFYIILGVLILLLIGQSRTNSKRAEIYKERIKALEKQNEELLRIRR
ncbi:MAG TPA: hypothetical protein VIM16_09345 [Mucilaginibacter sp.]